VTARSSLFTCSAPGSSIFPLATRFSLLHEVWCSVFPPLFLQWSPPLVSNVAPFFPPPWNPLDQKPTVWGSASCGMFRFRSPPLNFSGRCAEARYGCSAGKAGSSFLIPLDVLEDLLNFALTYFLFFHVLFYTIFSFVCGFPLLSIAEEGPQIPRRPDFVRQSFPPSRSFNAPSKEVR